MKLRHSKGVPTILCQPVRSGCPNFVLSGLESENAACLDSDFPVWSRPNTELLPTWLCGSIPRCSPQARINAEEHPALPLTEITTEILISVVSISTNLPGLHSDHCSVLIVDEFKSNCRSSVNADTMDDRQLTSWRADWILCVLSFRISGLNRI